MFDICIYCWKKGFVKLRYFSKIYVLSKILYLNAMLRSKLLKNYRDKSDEVSPEFVKFSSRVCFVFSEYQDFKKYC